MVSSFINPVISSASQLGVGLFEDSNPIQQRIGSSEEEFETLIRAVYRQVLGNTYVMESERLTVPESQLKQGELSVREFVRQVAKSELYRSRFFDNYPRYRAVELNFKHLLGRAPDDHAEMVHHTHLLDESGFAAEIDSYVDSDEYKAAFGEDTVPFYRGYKTQTGKNLAGFTYLFQLLRGASSSDQSSVKGSRSGLNRSLITNTPKAIAPPLGATSGATTDVNRFLANILNLKSQPLVTPTRTNPTMQTLSDDEIRQRQYQAFSQTQPIELWFGASADEIEIVIQAVYRQVLGNAYVMESERLTVPESQLKQGVITVREFVRQIAKSQLYRSRFFDNVYRYRAIELNFKHLLGRAPDDYSETIHHSNILDEQGFEADIDSYLDSDEYLDAFGENIVPYYRGYKTQTGTKILEFTNMLQLVRSNSSSDKNLASNNKPQLVRSLITNTPYGKLKSTDVSALLADLFKPKPDAQVNTFVAARTQAEQGLRQKIQEQESQITALQQQLAELRPFASIGTTQFSSSWQSSSSVTSTDEYTSLQQQADAQAKQITSLQEQIADTRRFATIGEARLNKWRSRVFNG
ncbi:phycobilisome rod-core linker polypeptide [Komarekiella delphini-convector]|nr:phycobilisome rod-core linker polypeptide [Komarekiella delphini-convector]